MQGGFDATMENGATFAPGIIEQAFSFDGADDWVRIGPSCTVNPDPSCNRKLSCIWEISRVVAQPAGRWRTIYADDSDGFWLYDQDIIDLGGEGLRINWWQGTNRFLGDSDIAPSEWHLIALTNDGSTFTGYLDGVFDGNSSFVGAKLPGDGGGLGIGKHQSEPFYGLIDEVRVYGRALSATEVSAFACVSSLDQVDAISDEVADLVASGVLDEGNGTALQATLEAVTKAITNDRPNVGNLLNAFINKVEGFVNGGILSPAEGQVLLDAAQSLIAQLGG